ncbi:MAG: RagB/SusD family nutrient uptake outer membrane protein [Bacteroidaceae bacterium]
MKKKNIYRKLIIPGCLTLLGGLSSCGDFLTLYPTNQVTDEQFWEDKKDLESVLGAAYLNMAKNVVEPALVWGEIRSDNFAQKAENNNDIRDLMNANLLPTSGMFNWASFYTTINYANKVLEHGELIMARDPSFSLGNWQAVKAEAIAIRALNYFYLVRAFRDVPYVSHSIDTDAEAVNNKPRREASQVVLTNILQDLESVKNDGMVEYGNSVFNKGRFSKRSIQALLADVYLWRASKNTSPDSVAKYPNMAAEDYAKCAEYSKWVIDDIKKEYENSYGPGNGNNSGSSALEKKYPLIIMEGLSSTTITDKAFNEIFGSGNSRESIFEIQFNGESVKNGAVTNYFKTKDTKNPLVGPSLLFQGLSAKPDDQVKIYSITDLRQWENLFYEKSGQTEYHVYKYASKSITTTDAEDVAKGVTYTSERYQNDANWIVYRLSDVMLMRAEALVQLGGEANNAEAFELVNAVFKRSNPKLKDENSLLFASYTTQKALEELIMRERQREFFAEGKRWFDLVRYAERKASTKPMLDILLKKYASNANAIKSKLGTMNSLYNPILKAEIKANPNLVQNPVWEKDETITKN